MRRKWMVSLLAFAVVAGACGGDSEDSSESNDDGGSAAEGSGWTVMSYSMADTDLESFMVGDVNEMGAVGSNDNLDIVALVDRSADYGDDELLDQGAWVGAKTLHIGEGTAEVVEDHGDLNLGDPQTLTDFIAASVEAYPSEHYALVISDHGASWPGVGPDETSGHDTLDLAELQSSIAAGIEQAGIEKLDILGFDACLMATYEVASVMAPFADRLIASSELEPGHGWNYNALTVAAEDGAVDVDTFGTALVDGFLGQAEEAGTAADITLSMIDLTQMDAITQSLSEFTSALAERAATVSPVVGRSLAVNLGYGRNPDPTQATHMTDLGSLAAAIGIDALDVSDQADAVQRAINDAVVHKIAGPQAADFSGMSIYFPPANEFFNSDYQSIPENGSGWVDFLAAYYGAGDAIPVEEQPTFTADEAEIFFDEDGLNISGFFDIAANDNISEATISYGLVNEDGSVTFIGDEPGAVAEDGSGQALGIYDLTVLTMSDGEDTAYAYLSLTDSEDGEGYTIDVPMAYYAPGDEAGETYQDVLLNLVVDGEGNIVQETYYSYDEEAGTYGEATLDPEGIIVPEVLQIDAEGNQEWVPTTDVGLYADLPNLQYDLEPLEAGTALYVELSVTDFGGNSDSVSATVEVP